VGLGYRVVGLGFRVQGLLGFRVLYNPEPILRVHVHSFSLAGTHSFRGNDAVGGEYISRASASRGEFTENNHSTDPVC